MGMILAGTTLGTIAGTATGICAEGCEAGGGTVLKYTQGGIVGGAVTGVAAEAWFRMNEKESKSYKSTTTENDFEYGHGAL